MRLRGKIALITGGNSGIGLATARLFVAEAVLYLASDDASNVTGTEIVVDGGATGAPLGAPIFRAG